MKIKSLPFLLIILLFASCSKNCIESENFYEVPLKCEIKRVLNEPDIKVLNVFDQKNNEVGREINDNTFVITPWDASNTNKKINYNNTYYVEVQNSDMSTELDSINLLYNVETDDCGTYVIKQMRFQYNGYTNFTGSFYNNVCQFTFTKH